MTSTMFAVVLVASAVLLSSMFVDTAYGGISTDKGGYTWTDKVRIKVVAHGWSSEESFVEISTSNHEIKSYHLSKARDRVYTGEIILTGFLHDADGDGKPDTNPRTSGNGSNDGFLETARDDTITISLRFADGTKMSTSAGIKWNQGEITLDRHSYDVGDAANLTVIDSDMNLNPRTLDKVKVNLFSDSDKAGIQVEAVETQEESGIFETTASFVQDRTSAGNRLFVIPGDTIYAKYEDHTMPEPYRISGSKEIMSSAIVDSSIPSTERLDTSPIILSDTNGKQLESFSPHAQIQIVDTITNDQIFAQGFTYFVQVKNNSTNHVESVSWMQGEILSKQSMDVSLSWIPKEPGTYKIEAFVWESVDDPAVMSVPRSSLIEVK